MKSPLSGTAIFAALAAALYLAFFFYIDRPVELWVHENCSGNWVFQAGELISYAANGSFVRLAVALLFILLIISDPGLNRTGTRKLLYVCLSVAVAIVIGEGFKYLLGRYRPVMLFEKNLYGFHFFSGKWQMNSTPSGHTLRAFSFLTALSLLYRRFSAVFISLAVLIGLSRIAVTAHYPGDIVFGAFIGVATAVWTHRYFFRGNPVGPEKD